jgi:Ca-activated chloride channel homolog
MLRFAQPLALLGLAGLAVIVLAARARPRRATSPRGDRTWLGIAFLAPVLVVVALAQPQLRSSTPRPTVLAVDVSASIGVRARAIERDWIAGAGADDCPAPCRVVRFAGDARAGAPNASDVGAGDRGQTDLQTAIDDAVGLVPRGGRVVVLSDGGQTEGDLRAAAAVAAARAVAVDWVDVPGASVRDAAITAIAAPDAVYRGDAVPLTLTVESTVAGRAVLGVRSDAGAVRHATIALRVGENPLLLLYAAARGGWHSFEATVSLSGDADPGDDSAAAVSDVLGPPRVLASGGTALRGPLSRRGIRVRTVAPAQLPAVAAGYAGYSAAVLDDIAATALTKAQIAALTVAVRENGLGLLAAGGPHSFSLGGYARSGLAPLLPVASLVPGNLQRRNVAIELVLDHSGSMIDPSGGAPKIVMTHVAARDTASFITAHQDQLGIVDFDIVPHTLVPLQRLDTTAAQRRIDDTVDGLQADGGTDIYAGLQAGLEAILRSDAPQRHIILMTDGISQPQDFSPLLARLRRAHITVATVALGSDADRALLARIAKGTGGHAYVTDIAKQLPRIFAKEDQLSAKPVRVLGRLSVAIGADSPVVRSLAGTRLPPLSGNVVTTLKRGAQADLVAGDAGGRSDPALAQWQFGAGRVVAWTPGLGRPWAAAWAVAAGPLWNDGVRWADRAASVPALTPLPLPGSGGILEIDLARSGGAGLLVDRITGTLVDATGVSRPVRFTAAGPGLYTTAVRSLHPGVYRFSLRTDGPRPLRNSGEVALPYPAEHSPVTAEPSPLGALVAQTRGQVLDAARPKAIASATHPLERLLALAALIVFLAAAAGRMAARLRRRRRAVAPPSRLAAQRRRARSSSSERALSSSSSSGSADVDAAT